MAEEKVYTPREVVGELAKSVKEKIEAFAAGVEDLRKREVRAVAQKNLDLCPMCGNADLPGSCICLAKSASLMTPVKAPKTPGAQPVTPGTPVPGSHGKPAGMAKEETKPADVKGYSTDPAVHEHRAKVMENQRAQRVGVNPPHPKTPGGLLMAKEELCKTCGKMGDLCKCMQKDEMPGAAPKAATPAAAKPTIPGKKPAGTPVASPYLQHAKRAKDMSMAIMGIHRDATASEHQATADAHSIAAKHSPDAKTQQMHLAAARTHQQWAAHKTVPELTQKSEGLAKNGLQATPPPIPAAAKIGRVAQINTNAKAKSTAMPLADLKSVANPTTPHKAPGLPGMTPALPSMEGFKSVASNPTAMPGGTLTNPPQSAAGVRGTPVAALRARAQRGTPSNQILQHKSAAGIRGK